MKYNYLGASGLRVSEICLGAMTLGREADEATSIEMLDTFAAAGGNMIDTANVYGPGTSEEVLGRWLANQQRDDWVIATKARFPVSDGPNNGGLSRKHLIASVDASLRRLGTDYIDLFQIHCWDPQTPIEETLSTLDGLVTSGKVRYLGSSNLYGWQIQKMVATAKANGLEAFVSHQPQYNLLARSTEWEVLPVCEAEGLGVLPWGPLRGGWLSGRYSRDMGGAPAGSRVKTAEDEGWDETWARYNTPRTWAILDELNAVAGELGATVAQVAIRWTMQNSAVTAPILGASTMDQLTANLGVVDLALDADQMQRLDAVSTIDVEYPYDGWLERVQQDR